MQRILDWTQLHHAIIVFFVIVFFLITGFFNYSSIDNQQFSIFTESLLNGQPHLSRLDPYVGALDTVLVDGRYYLPLGPFPALLLTPFVYVAQLLHTSFLQGYLQFFCR